RKVMEVLPAGVKQYVFISTCDVYERGTGKRLDETSKFEERDFGGEAGAYILGKVTLEKELLECAAKKGMHTTVIRPAVIYGPGNYAPREGIYFQWMSKAGQILVPEDADGWFQMVYVRDAAKILYASLLNEKAYDEAFNLCGETLTYQDFADALEKIQPGLQRVGVTVDLVNEKGIPLPFPMTKEESETYAGDKAHAFAGENGIEFTTLVEGLRESYADFLSQGE
ncbi:MAG: NAD-dependent epimerase/dehydratase family protein, partial [Lachnospiraceae bacterium]|nr:NAD-dependent epimerase/dehydratase family protein [Lachnospiraceae bacterium]